MPQLDLVELPKDTRSYEIKVENRVVGFIAWRQTTDWSTRGHVSYEISEEHRNKGYATQALRTLIQHIAFEYGSEFEQIQLCCVPDNVASRRVIEKCGGERDLSRGEIFKDPTDGKWTLSYWVPVKKEIGLSAQDPNTVRHYEGEDACPDCEGWGWIFWREGMPEPKMAQPCQACDRTGVKKVVDMVDKKE